MISSAGRHHAKGLALSGVALLLLVLTFASPAHAQTSGIAYAKVDTQVNLTPVYDAFAGGSAAIVGSVNATSLSPGVNYVVEIQTTFKPVISGFATQLTGPNVPIACLPTPLAGGVYSCIVTPPPNTVSFQLSILGNDGGDSFLWRYLSGAPIIDLTSGIQAVSYSTIITVPRGTVLSQVYGVKGGTLPVPAPITNGNQVSYNVTSGAPGVNAGTPALLVFQSSSFVPASIAITVVALVAIALAALGFFAQGEVLLNNEYARLRSTLTRPFGPARSFFGRKGFKFRNLFQPRKLLALFIICAFLMVALGALGGPDPRLKAYVVADTASVPAITGQLQTAAGGAPVLVLTPEQDYADFNVMSSVGQFNVAVISNFPTASLQEDIGFILPYLGNVPVIVVDTTANASLVSTIENLYPNNQVLAVGNATQLTPGEASQLSIMLALNQRTNIVGLHISVGDFKLLLAFEAVLSMVLVFLGWSYLGSLTSESRSMSDISYLATLIGVGVFVFVFSEVLYVVTSSTLAVPLSLHAVNSDAHDVTAIGLLGFGGGSTPRLIAGFAGLLLGAVGVEGGLQVRKRDFALIAGILLFVFANPLSLGTYVFQGILLLLPIGNFAFGGAYTNSLTIKGFIYGFGAALGGGVTPAYVLSAGKILYFAGLVPLAYLKKMGRTTTVITLLVVALMVGDGGVRVGEMTPDKTVVAIVPGLIAGFGFAALLLALAFIERYLRGNWKSRA